MVYQQCLTQALQQLITIDSMTQILKLFYKADKKGSPCIIPPLHTKIVLPTDLMTLQQYCPGQPVPNHLDFASVHILMVHTKPFPELLAAFNTWAAQLQVTLTLNPIQEEQTKDIRWVVYSTNTQIAKNWE